MPAFKYCLFGLVGLCGSHFLLAQSTGGSPATKPFTITGSIGASANFYSSNEPIKTRPTFSWSTYGNLEGRAGKWTLPLYFIVNQYNNSNTSPYIQAGISPTYQWVRLHLGYRYIPFSPFTFEGQSFRGAGIELYPKSFRFAAFYGRLNKAVNEDTSTNRFRVPQYSRTGYGLKLGVGNALRYIDLLYFHAKDDSSSAAVTSGSRNNLRAQENAVLGTSFKLTIKKNLIWTGDAAVSGLVRDLSGKRSFDSTDQSLQRLISNFLPGNAGVSAHYAGQSSLTYFTGTFMGNVGYRRVQPGFRSLGTPYMIDDVELISVTNSFSAAKRKVNVNTNLSQQHNNLSKSLDAEMKTQVGNLNINTILGQHMNVNLNFSGYNFKQRNDKNNLPDTIRLADSLLLRQQITQFGINPSYNLTKGNNIHFVSGNATLQKLTDKNPRTAAQTNSENLSASLAYSIAFLNKPYSFSVNYIHSRYKQTANSYTSNGATVGASAQLLKNQSLNLQGSLGYYFNNFNNNTTQKNTSYSFSAGYRARKHSARLFADYLYTPPNNAINEAINRTIPYALASKYLYSGITYNYTF